MMKKKTWWKWIKENDESEWNQMMNEEKNKMMKKEFKNDEKRLK